ncbi:MAG: HAD family hydrolase [Myxococcota bacterium]
MSTPITAVGGGPILAVSFDVDGTLYRPSFKLFWRALTLGAFRPLRLQKPARDATRGRTFPDGDTLRREVAREMGNRAGMQQSEAEALMEHVRTRIIPPLLRGAASRDATEALTRLKQGGVRTAAFSDLDTASKIAALGFPSGLFDVVIAAEDAGAYKPGAPAFALLAQRLGVPAATILHVGDRADTDAAGALSAGMVAAVLYPAEAPRGALQVSSLRELADRVLLGRATAPAQLPAA